MTKKWLKRTLTVVFSFYLGLCLLLYFVQEQFLFHPYPLSKDHKFEFYGEFEELILKTDDGHYINSIHFKSVNPEGVILFFHGNTGNNQICGPVAYDFVKRNWDVIVFDYREFGKSDGDLDLDNLLNDPQLIYEYAKEKFNPNEIIIYGQSIGTGVAIYLASKNNCAHLILESPYSSIGKIAKAQFPYFPINLILSYDIKTHEYMENVESPVSIIHGKKDQTIPSQHSTDLAKAYPESTLLLIPNAGHNNISTFESYWNRIDEILDSSSD